MSIYDKASLVLIPSGTKTSKVYSQKPVNGDGDFTFSRSTGATRVNADGNIEKETQNLLLQSNSFTTGWSLSNVTMTSGQAGYDGTNDAWLMTDTNSGGYGIIDRLVTTGGITTFSCYAKSGTTNIFGLRPIGGSSPYVFFDLSNGTFESAGDTANLIDWDIQDAGSGWYRCSVTTSATATQVLIYIATTGGGLAPSGSTIYIQDAQLEQGMVARDYIETTTAAVEGGITDNVPRLDYTDSSCPSLLLEGQRTNLITLSEALSIGTSGSTTEQNTADTTSPEGYYNATKILGSTSYLAKGVGSAFSGNNTTSVFLKYGNDSEIGVYMYDGAYYRVTFNIVNGTISSTFGGVTGTITDYGNGWYRCTIYKSTAANVVEVGVDSLAGFVYTYGWQHEYNASYATSYIPTYGTSVTRAKDDCTLSDVSNVIADSKGSFYIEGNLSTMDTSGVIVLTAGANTQDLFYIFISTAGVLLCEWFDGGTLQARFEKPAGSISVGDSFKIAAAYQDNDFVAYWNGTQIGTDSSGTAPTPTLLRIGKYNVDNYTGGSYTNAMVFPTRLSNEELAALTTI